MYGARRTDSCQQSFGYGCYVIFHIVCYLLSAIYSVEPFYLVYLIVRDEVILVENHFLSFYSPNKKLSFQSQRMRVVYILSAVGCTSDTSVGELQRCFFQLSFHFLISLYYICRMLGGFFFRFWLFCRFFGLRFRFFLLRLFGYFFLFLFRVFGFFFSFFFGCRCFLFFFCSRLFRFLSFGCSFFFFFFLRYYSFLFFFFFRSFIRRCLFFLKHFFFRFFLSSQLFFQQSVFTLQFGQLRYYGLAVGFSFFLSGLQLRKFAFYFGHNFLCFFCLLLQRLIFFILCNAVVL